MEKQPNSNQNSIEHLDFKVYDRGLKETLSYAKLIQDEINRGEFMTIQQINKCAYELNKIWLKSGLVGEDAVVSGWIGTSDPSSVYRDSIYELGSNFDKNQYKFIAPSDRSAEFLAIDEPMRIGRFDIVDADDLDDEDDSELQDIVGYQKPRVVLTLDHISVDKSISDIDPAYGDFCIDFERLELGAVMFAKPSLQQVEYDLKNQPNKQIYRQLKRCLDNSTSYKSLVTGLKQVSIDADDTELKDLATRFLNLKAGFEPNEQVLIDFDGVLQALQFNHKLIDIPDFATDGRLIGEIIRIEFEDDGDKDYSQSRPGLVVSIPSETDSKLRNLIYVPADILLSISNPSSFGSSREHDLMTFVSADEIDDYQLSRLSTRHDWGDEIFDIQLDYREALRNPDDLEEILGRAKDSIERYLYETFGYVRGSHMSDESFKCMQDAVHAKSRSFSRLAVGSVVSFEDPLYIQPSSNSDPFYYNHVVQGEFAFFTLTREPNWDSLMAGAPDGLNDSLICSPSMVIRRPIMLSNETDEQPDPNKFLITIPFGNCIPRKSFVGAKVNNEQTKIE